MIDFSIIQAQQHFLNACTSAGTEPAAAEATIAFAGREFLPPFVLSVLGGGPKTAEYWNWLAREVTLGSEAES